MMMLKDATGGTAFIRGLIEGANDMALAFAGEDDDRVRAHLDRSCQNMERGLVREVGSVRAAQIVAALKRAVMAQKAEIEALDKGRA